MDDNMRFWNRTAGLYTSLQERRASESYDETAERCLPYVRGRRVLEAGCGTGQFTGRLAPSSAGWTATDFSPRMVKETSARCGDHAECRVMDMTDIPYDDGTFDAVLAANILHIMPEPEKALREAWRVLKRDGVLIAPTFIYEGRVSRVRMAVLRTAGFRTFHRWTMDGFTSFVEEGGFTLMERDVLSSRPLREGLGVFRKKV